MVARGDADAGAPPAASWRTRRAASSSTVLKLVLASTPRVLSRAIPSVTLVFNSLASCPTRIFSILLTLPSVWRIAGSRLRSRILAVMIQETIVPSGVQDGGPSLLGALGCRVGGILERRF